MPAKIGLLPFYIALYDKTNPKRRPQMQANADLIAEEIRKLGVEVVQAPISCVKPEFEKSIKLLEDNKVDAIVTLHLAYSPSLESIDAVAGTDIPVVILDTTPDYDFNFNVNCGEKIGPNHGIHGVQDFSNLLIRRKKPFVLVAGHWKHSAVITAKLKTALEAAVAASKFRNSRVGIIGKPFEGMGDFAVPYDKLKQDFNMTVVTYDKKDQPADADFDKKVAAEMEADKERFITDKLTPEAHKTTAETCIRVRDWMEAQKLDAFTASFLDVNRKDGWDTVPFLEASKALARGTGYAGEGDVLTANLVSAMLSIYPETTFTEMFCPDWQNDQIFLSHMGEANVDLYAHNPQRIANRAYANRMGNGSEASGDGYRYRGRGFIGITGKANYQTYAESEWCVGDLMSHPEWLSKSPGDQKSSMFFWLQNNCNRFADADDVKGLTKRINGGLNGYDSRLALTEKFKEVFNVK